MARKSSAAKKFKRLPKWAKIAVIVIVVAVIAGYIYLSAFHPDIIDAFFDNNDGQNAVLVDGEMKIHFINIGQGDAIYIQFPDGKDMLIDGGRTGSATGYVTSVLDYLKAVDNDNTLNYLMVTHPDYDHYSLLDEVIDYYDVDNFYLPYATVDWGDTVDADTEKFDGAVPVDTAAYAEFMKTAVTEADANVFVNTEIFDIAGLQTGISFRFYALSKAEYAELPSAERNDMSPIGVLTYNGYKIIFSGDAGEDANENYLADSPTTDCDVFKVEHHGSDSEGCNSAELLNDITPEYAVIFAGLDNSYGLPNQGTLDRLSALGVTTYITYQTGTVVLTVDKNGAGIFTFKNGL